ncbi:MAG TPA: hypothetical protein VGC42_20400 [Kofleriaceae bacterium]
MRSAWLFAALTASFVLGAAGCGTDTSGTSGGDDVGPSGSGSDTDDPIVGMHALSWGPLSVPATTESTQCIWLRLDNDAEIKVHQLHNVLGATSHHLIVYKDDMDTTEQTTPVPCTPFAGALNVTGKIFPMMITQKHDDLLELPHHVAYTLAPHQMIKIEMHYLNAGEVAADATATITFAAADPTAIKDEANILFIGTPDITLPANAMTSVHEFFSPAHANLDTIGAKFFALTGHTHKLGLSVEINAMDPVAGTSTPIYNPPSFLWNEPVTATFNPELTLTPNGGFDFTCNYFNNTPKSVSFGESTDNEMCFFWAYYYPSNGSHVCIHTTKLGNLDICCPDAGAQLCSFLDKNK